MVTRGRRREQEGSIATWGAREWGGRECKGNKRDVIEGERKQRRGKKEAEIYGDLGQSERWGERAVRGGTSCRVGVTGVKEEIGGEKKQ